MTHFAPVAPLAVHRQLADRKSLGFYNLIIASEILKDRAGYKAFWQDDRHRLGGTLIMDNGVIELGYPLPLAQLVIAAELAHADILILPDTIDDANMTIKQVRFSNPEWKKLGLPTKTMGVVQGKNFAECVDCADAHIQHGVDYLAIPRGLTPNLGSRTLLVEHIASEHPKTPLHLLGFSENIYDDIRSAVASPLVMGIDAATPVWLGMQEQSIGSAYSPPTRADYGRRPEWFWQAGLQGEEPLNAIVANLVRVRAWLASASEQISSGLSHEANGQHDAKGAPTRRVAPLDPAGQ